ncbi:MAG: tetratricopeptide repeat protein [Actinomycetota bacterium]|nr:tetratricopeptide repeat protein [Actinomycetota bacterium]
MDLDEDDYARVLTVHMAALVAVDAVDGGRRAPGDAIGLSIYLLDREHAYWQALHTHRAGHTQPQVMARAVFLATLTRPLPRERAIGVLRHVELASSAETCGQIVDDHAACYPPADTGTVFEPLYPDRLGEDFLALQLPGHTLGSYTPDGWATDALPRLLAAVEGPGVDAAPQHTRNIVTVLIEAARRWPHLAAGHLYPLLRARPHLALAAGGAALSALTDIDGIDLTVLEAIEPLLPDGQHVGLDIGAAAITQRLTEHRLTAISDPARCAALHATLGWRLGNAGLHQQALTPTEDATGIYRRLAEANPAAYLPGLAASLNNLGIRLSDVGRREAALAPTEEATDIYRRLAQANPAAYLPDLAASLNNLGTMLSGLGQWEAALAPSKEAVAIRRRLAEANPAAYLPGLAASLNNLGIWLSDLGQREAALAPAEEATGIYRRLAEANPAAYLPDLAMSLSNLGATLSDRGQREAALAPPRKPSRSVAGWLRPTRPPTCPTWPCR